MHCKLFTAEMKVGLYTENRYCTNITEHSSILNSFSGISVIECTVKCNELQDCFTIGITNNECSLLTTICDNSLKNEDTGVKML